MSHHAHQNAPMRWSLPRGRVLRRALRRDPTQEYLLYVPTELAEHASVLVSVHGITRNFLEQAGELAPLCEQRGAVMLAPIFNDEMHSDYQRLGRKGRGMRVDRLLHEFLSETAQLTGADVSQFHLFGFSAGAQFAHRYLMVHPHRVLGAAIAAAGWYTFPDSRQRYPYGIRPQRKLEGVVFNPEEFLRVPIEVLVGELDAATANLRQTERCVAQQGVTRLERARRWVEAMRNAALEYGLEPRAMLTVVPGIDHSFTRFCSHGALSHRVDRALFGTLPSREPLHLVVRRRSDSDDRPRRVAHEEPRI